MTVRKDEGKRSAVSRNLLILSFVSLLNDFSTEMVFPLLPTFVKALGGTALVIGLMEGTAESVAAFLRYASGRLSDRLGRRKGLTLLGYSVSGISKVFYPVASHWAHVVTIRASDRVGKGFREAPRDAMLSESVHRAYWGFAFGFHRTLDTTGALLGPLFGLLLIHYLGTAEAALRTIFLVAAIPGIAGVVLLLALRETGPGRATAAPGPALVPIQARRGPLARYLLVTAFFTLGNLSIIFLTLRADDLGISLVNIIFLFLFFNAAEAVMSLPVGYLTDRVGRAPVLASAYAGFAIIFALVVLLDPSSWVALLPFFIATGVVKALREGQGRAFVADLSRRAHRGTGFGAYHATVGLLALPGGLIAGALWELDYRWTFFAAEVFCTTTFALFLYYWLRGRFAGGQEDARQDQGRPGVDQGSQALGEQVERQDA